MKESDILQIVASSISLNNTFLVYGSILIAILAIVVTILLFIVQIYLNKKRSQYIQQIADDVLKKDEVRREILESIVMSKGFSRFLLERVEMMVDQYLETQKERIQSKLTEAIKNGLNLK